MNLDLSKNTTLLENLSIVIPSLGGDDLESTLNTLTKYKYQPNEIIVSIPKGYQLDLSHLNINNLFIINSSSKGQVNQRIEGFKRATGKYVLQMDDDIKVNKKTIKGLYDHISSCKKDLAISPILCESLTKKDIFKFNNENFNDYGNLVSPKNFINTCINKIFHGKTFFEQGEITNLGSNIPIGASKTNFVSSQWLPGGMVIHKKENLILKNYYPFSGKAYSEDLIHSHFLMETGVELIIAPNLKAYIEIDFGQRIKTFKDVNYFLKEKIKEIRAKSFFLKISNRSYLTFYFFL